jgi:hypothetical protein
MFEIIENIDYGHFAGWVIGYVAGSAIMLYFFEFVLGLTKIKKIK